jgi:DNA anti-recombination protein RmuC
MNMNAILREDWSTAPSFNGKHDEVPVSSTEVLEANVASIRVDLNELKVDFRAAVARLDDTIKSAVAKLEAEIRAMAAKAEKDLQLFADRVETRFSELRTDSKHFADGVETQFSESRADSKHFADRVETQFSELRADNKSLREKVDKTFETLFTKIDTDVKETNKALNELSKVVLRMDSRLSAIVWVGAGLVALITLAITVGRAFKWF